MQFVSGDIIASDLIHMVPNADAVDFAVLTSAMHMAWMRTVCGRLKNDYRYSRDLCYNTFPWPSVTAAQRGRLNELGRNILRTRENVRFTPEGGSLTLADLYNSETMPEELRRAHAGLDAYVDSLYTSRTLSCDEDRLPILFKKYAELIAAKEAGQKKKPSGRSRKSAGQRGE